MAHVPQDLLDHIRALEREVDNLRGRSQMRPAMNQILAGDVIIGEGGELIARTPAGVQLFKAGQSSQGDWGVGMGREDGTAALTVGDEEQAGGQMIRMFMRDASAPDPVIVMDDAWSGRFLGRPSMPIPMQSTAAQSTSSTSLAIAWTGASRLMNAVLWAGFETYTPSGVTADVRFEDDNGLIESWSASTSNGWTSHEITKPVRQAFMDHVNYRVRHRVTSGSGTIRTNCLGVYTRNTFTESEAP